jgi:hypothetical protein
MSEKAERSSIWSSGLWAFLAAIVMLGWIAWQNRVEDTAPDRAPYDAILGARSSAEAEALKDLLGEAYGVLRSPAFRDTLLSLSDRYPAIYARDAEQSANMARIASIVALEPIGSRFAPAQVEITDNTSGGLGAAGEGGVSGRYAAIQIERIVLAAYGSPDVVVRSCAINVAAHEYAHTIVLTPMGFGNAFRDTRAGEDAIPNRRRPGTPVASYLIGAAAQCAWLERQGRISRGDIAACIEVFGVAAFNSDRCRQFGGGAPVAPRADLAPPAPPL